MNPEYYEGIVLVTIARLLAEGQNVGQVNILKHAKIGRTTLLKAIKRLEEKHRLGVFRPSGPGPGGVRHQYEILDPPSEYDKLALELHLVWDGKPNGR